MSPDVTVLGMVVPTCLLLDIAMDVPYGETVVIPADKAQTSKDLWRCIGQKQLFRMKAGPYGMERQFPTSRPPAGPDRAAVLEEENRQLREVLAEQGRQAQALQQEHNLKLDAILGLLRTGVPLAAVDVRSEVVSGEAPTFIPHSITPENAASRIEPRESQSETDSVSQAATKLRELRQRRK